MSSCRERALAIGATKGGGIEDLRENSEVAPLVSETANQFTLRYWHQKIGLWPRRRKSQRAAIKSSWILRAGLESPASCLLLTRRVAYFVHEVCDRIG